jgi:hypothetical protein
MGKIPAPAPGVYAGVPFEDYLRWDAVSQSQLKELARSPAHLRAKLAAPDEDSEALRIGRAVHAAVLEPDTFEKAFGIMPDGTDLRTKVGKELRDAIAAKGATPLKQAEADRVFGVRDAILAHAAAGHLIRSEGPAEQSLVWIDEETGVLCKARHDKHAHAIGGGVVVDVKTTTDASPREFERTVFNFGYHRQGAFYMRGAEALKLPVSHFAIVAVEKDAPFACAVYRLNEAALDAGDAEVVALLNRFKRCTAAGTWPAYPETVQDLALPDWAWGVSDRLTKELEAEAGS